MEHDIDYTLNPGDILWLICDREGNLHYPYHYTRSHQKPKDNPKNGIVPDSCHGATYTAKRVKRSSGEEVVIPTASACEGGIYGRLKL
eukprot:818887-Amorphochlora_amoeboformis.AAC.6